MRDTDIMAPGGGDARNERPGAGTRDAVTGEDAATAGEGTAMTGESTGAAGERTGMAGEHTAVTGEDAGLAGEYTGVTDEDEIVVREDRGAAMAGDSPAGDETAAGPAGAGSTAGTAGPGTEFAGNTPGGTADTGTPAGTAGPGTEFPGNTPGDTADTGTPAGTAGPGTEFSGNGGTRPQLLSGEELQALVGRWREIQAQFVDEPRSAVADADALVSDLMQRLTAIFAAERASLESRLTGGGELSTEDLRQGLRRYRSFFERLLTA